MLKKSNYSFHTTIFSKISTISPEFRSLHLASYFSKNFAHKISSALLVGPINIRKWVKNSIAYK